MNTSGVTSGSLCVDFDAGMVGTGVLTCRMTSLRNRSIAFVECDRLRAVNAVAVVVAHHKLRALSTHRSGVRQNVLNFRLEFFLAELCLSVHSFMACSHCSLGDAFFETRTSCKSY